MFARSCAALALCVVASLGCSSSTSSETPSGDDAGTDAQTSDGTAADTGSKSDSTTGDTASASDTASGSEGGSDTMTDAAGVVCGDKGVCMSGETCCASPTAGGVNFTCVKGGCPDGGAAILCDGPEDCMGATPICCAEADVTGTFPSCGFKSGVADCRATCTSMVTPSCPSKATVRPCHTSDNCPEPGYPKCCEFSSPSGDTATFCAPTYLESYATACY